MLEWLMTKKDIFEFIIWKAFFYFGVCPIQQLLPWIVCSCFICSVSVCIHSFN
uniref:Uncharacterized protein n=1 Tax=Rhizophora mucronata TaxID=61149 RepID=A0A2P2QQ28_RHIMU